MFILPLAFLLPSSSEPLNERVHARCLHGWCLAIGVVLAITLPVEAFATPTIAITVVPPYGSVGSMAGTVSGVDYSQYRVAPFIFVPGLGWYSKPYEIQPTVAINPDGTWSADVNTAGPNSLDPRATIHGAWLVPGSYVVPWAQGIVRVPAALDAFPHDLKERYGPSVNFAGRIWAVKDAPLPVGPGPNRFSTLPAGLWSDDAGLHLTLREHDDGWWATEVTLLGAHLGYGTYAYRTNTRTDNLDVNVTFGGGFTFDDYGDEQSPDGSRNREIDMGEDSRWGVATDPNTQYVKQPFDHVPANRHRFNLPDLSGGPALTRILIWKPESLRFITLKGHYSPIDYPADAIVDDYTYTHDPASGRYVPIPGRERFHFNLWLNRTVNPTAPSDEQPVEVVVSDFTFEPLTGSLDLNGDDRSDLVWHNAQTGTTYAWLMNGTSVSSHGGLLTDPAWTVVATGDLNGDGKSDLIWHNAQTGTTYTWLMNGTSILSHGALLADPAWSVVATGDLNGDGKSDLIWHNAQTGTTYTWLMNGTSILSHGALLADPAWSVVATGDLNGDGKSDLIWHNAQTGATYAWLMNGTSISSYGALLTDPAWSVVATGDLNGDGKSDLIWHNAQTGTTYVWLMNGTSISSHGALLTDPAWNVVTTGDLDGDGKSDLIWYNAATGTTYAWLMNGTSVLSHGALLTDPNWKVTGS